MVARLVRRAPLAALCLLATTLSASAAFAAWPNSTTAPLTLVSGAGIQAASATVPDGNGGFFIVWGDNHTGNLEIFAQRYDANGLPLWNPSGVAVATGAVLRGYPDCKADGTGGLLVFWPESFPPVGMRVQRLNASGVAQWASPGVRLATQVNDLTSWASAIDGNGGIFITWEYNFSPSDHDIYVQHLSPAGALLMGAAGTAIATPTSMQDHPVAESDGSGGAWICWRDNRATAYDIFTQHLNAANAAQLATNGACLETFVPGDLPYLVSAPDGFGGMFVTFPLNPYGDYDIELEHIYPDATASNLTVSLYATGNQEAPSIVPDGSGGAYLAWRDDRSDPRSDIYGSHVTAYGTIASGWDPSGQPIASAPDLYEEYVALAADGQGGVVACWTSGAGTYRQLLATRLKPDGTRAPGWKAGGTVVFNKLVTINSQMLDRSGTGGAFCVFNAGSNTDLDIFAQRLDAFGPIGSPEPKISKVKDVPNDQGGAVRVSWDASPLDAGLSPMVTGYQLWRQVPASLALAALRAGRARLLADGEAPRAGGRTLRATADAAATYYWEYVDGVGAQQLPGYSMVASTLGDSVAASNPRTLFMVEATGTYYTPGPVYSSTWWDSAPDSGYSVDNLPPAIPVGTVASWNASGASLQWNANAEPDLAGYRVYRGSTPGFTPSPGNRVAAPTQSWFNDPGAPPSYYRLSAIDIHGNESGTALILPSGTAAVDDGLPTELAFALVSPNPTRGVVSARADLPRAAALDAGVFDMAGRRVATLASGPYAAGRWTLTWRGESGEGAIAAPGVYYVRMQAEGREWTRRVVLLR